MQVSLYNQFGARNSAPVFEAIAQGLQRLGISVSYHNDSADIAVIWSVLWSGRMRRNQAVWQTYTQSGRTVIVAEVGMIDRGRTWKLGVNGTGRQCYPNAVDQPDRDKILGMQIHPWRRSGQNIVIALQRADSYQWHGQPAINQWLQHTVDKIRQHSDRPIVVRPHPRYPVTVPAGCMSVKPRLLTNTYDSFDFDNTLVNAWAVVNWNSAPGPQAAIAGVPVFVGNASLAAEVGNTDLSMIENPQYPQRQQWLTWLAHTEWTVNEIALGLPLSRLLHSVGIDNLDDRF